MKTQNKREAIINFLSSNKNFETEKFLNMLIITYLNQYEKPSAVIFDSPKSSKPRYNYYFNTLEDRQNFISKNKEIEAQNQEHKKKSEAEYNSKKSLIKQGTILYADWGYEQTNIDFYIVLERKNDFVILQEIGQDKIYDYNFNDRGQCTPNKEILIGNPFRKKINKYARINLNSFSTARIYDNTPKYWSAYA